MHQPHPEQPLLLIGEDIFYTPLTSSINSPLKQLL
jgi:hypothetical protein